MRFPQSRPKAFNYIYLRLKKTRRNIFMVKFRGRFKINQRHHIIFRHRRTSFPEGAFQTQVLRTTVFGTKFKILVKISINRNNRRRPRKKECLKSAASLYDAKHPLFQKNELTKLNGITSIW